MFHKEITILRSVFALKNSFAISDDLKSDGMLISTTVIYSHYLTFKNERGLNEHWIKKLYNRLPFWLKQKIMPLIYKYLI
jgi:hypothetical protein